MGEEILSIIWVMSDVLDDNQIKTLIAAPKAMTSAEYEGLKDLSKVKGKHKESEVSIKSQDNSTFIIKIRQNTLNPLDFTVILGYFMPNTNVIFRIKRFNGKYHEHKNKIEGNIFYDFHIHLSFSL